MIFKVSFVLNKSAIPANPGLVLPVVQKRRPASDSNKQPGAIYFETGTKQFTLAT
jgi:hypothetical protein